MAWEAKKSKFSLSSSVPRAMAGARLIGDWERSGFRLTSSRGGLGLVSGGEDVGSRKERKVMS